MKANNEICSDGTEEKMGQNHNIEMENDDNQLQKQNINPLNNTNVKTYNSFFNCLARVLNICLSSFYFGYVLGYLGTFSFQSIITLYGIGKDQNLIHGVLQGITSVGGGIGAIASSYLLSTFSHRKSLIFINFIAFASGIIVLIPHLYIFFVGRLIQGVCAGLYSATVPLLIKQYTPNQLRGTLGALNQTLLAFGLFFVFSFQLILKNISSQLEHWRIIYGFTLITIIIQTLALLFIFRQQTPKHLLQKSRDQQCIQFLKILYKPQYLEQKLKQIKEDLNIKPINDIQNPLSAQNQVSRKQLSELALQNQKLQKGKKLRFLISIHLAILQQFVGINAVITYGLDIVIKVLPSFANVIPVILNFELLLASFVTSFLLAKVGRKTILQFGTLTSFITLSIVILGYLVRPSNIQTSNVMIILGLALYVANFGMSLGPVFWLYIPEIVEPEMIPFPTLANWASSSLVVIFFPILTNLFSSPLPLFIFFAGWGIVSYKVNGSYLIETKGKKEKEIREKYAEMIM